MKKFFTIWPLCVILVLTLFFFYQTVLFGKLPVPSDTLVGLYHPWRDLYATAFPRGVPFKNFLITDPVRQQIPWRKIAIEAWKSGIIPRQNPYTFTGVPIDANIQAASFYPLNIFFFAFSFPVAWTLLIMLQPFLAGMWLYLYLRHHKLSIPAALLGAIAWSYSGFAVSWFTWGTIVQTALWLPLILLSIDHVLAQQKKPILWTGVCAFGIAMTVTAGHAQVALYVLCVGAAYALWRFSGLGKKGNYTWLVLSALIALLVTIGQWLPFATYLPETVRITAADTWKKAGWFIPWPNIVQFLVPDFFGNPATMNYWGEWNYGEFVGFIGVIPFLFSVSAFFGGGISSFFSIIALIALLFMVPNPVANLPFAFHIPILSVLQPTRLMVVVDFALAVLAAIGYDAWIQGKNVRLSKVLWYVGFVFVGIWFICVSNVFWHQNLATASNLLIAKRNLILPTVLFGAFVMVYLFSVKKESLRSGWLAQLTIFALVIFELFRFGWKFTPFTPVSEFFPNTAVISFLQHQPGPFRVMSLDDRILPPNTASFYGIETIEGYDPLAPKRFEDYVVALERGEMARGEISGFNRIYTVHNIDSPLLPYMNVAYVLALSDIDRPFLRKVFEEGQTRVYAYDKNMPRVYLADRIEEVSRDQVLSKLVQSQGNTTLVSSPISILSLPLAAGEAAQIQRYLPDRIVVHATTENKRLLVLLNRFDPRWDAHIDGQPADIREVNYLFMGAVIPIGTHEIVFSYR